jgi:hypothetical protein
MSADTGIDQRLREAFHAEDEWIPDVSLTDVRSSAQRSTVRRRAALAAAAAVVLAGGVAVAVTRGGPESGADPAIPAPSPSSSTSEAPLAVVGSWVSVPLTERRVREVLTDAGLGQHADAVVATLQPGPRARLLLRIEAGFLDLQIKRDGDMEDIDRQTYLAGDGLIRLTSRDTDAESRLGWAVTSDRELTFTWRSTTETDLDGVPAEAYQRVVYTAVPFTPST